MVGKFTVEGWIRAKVDYSQATGTFGDTDHFYFKNHSQFKFGEESKSSRIKSFEYTDKQEKVTYFTTFGYDQIGVSFTVVAEDSKDRGSIFRSSLSRAIRGYKNFTQYFLNDICPKSIKATLKSQSLLISLYGFLEDLTSKQQNSLLRKIKRSLHEYTSDVRFVLANKGLEEHSDERSMRLLTMKEFNDLSKFDFNTITVVSGEIYLFVGHHLFATWFILEDPSLSLKTVATWGFISSLKLKDLHYEIEDYSEKVERLKTNLDRKEKSFIPTGLGSFQEQLIELEKEQVFIEDDLREFTTLSSRIYKGLEKNEYSNQIVSVLENMNSLPHSTFQAYGILRMKQLGRFTSFKRSLVGLSLQLKKLEMKLMRREVGLFVFLLVLISAFVYVSAIEISYIADILQILTFLVAFGILVLRFLPTR